MVERIYYDGECGVCHWAVKFVASRDGTPPAFRFAPLHGETFRGSFPEIDEQDLPDSMIVESRDRQLLMRSDGMVHILRRLGGLWRPLALLLRAVPRPVRDTGYDLFARVRHRFAARPAGTCPILPPDMRGRFDP